MSEAETMKVELELPYDFYYWLEDYARRHLYGKDIQGAIMYALRKIQQEDIKAEEKRKMEFLKKDIIMSFISAVAKRGMSIEEFIEKYIVREPKN